MREGFEPSWAFSFQMAFNRLYQEAMEVYMADPSKAECIADVIRECLERIGECQEEPGVGDGNGGGTDCPPGTRKVGGRCKPII